jgi:hypothetical protein
MAVHLPNFWTLINARKALLPAVLSSLWKAGGGGYFESAMTSTPVLLARMPREVLGDGQAMLNELLQALLQAAKLPAARKECSAAILQCSFAILQCSFEILTWLTSRAPPLRFGSGIWASQISHPPQHPTIPTPHP